MRELLALGYVLTMLVAGVLLSIKATDQRITAQDQLELQILVDQVSFEPDDYHEPF